MTIGSVVWAELFDTLRTTQHDGGVAPFVFPIIQNIKVTNLESFASRDPFAIAATMDVSTLGLPGLIRLPS